jgi:hypothetical protein
MTEKIGKGRLAEIKVTLPIPETATPEEIQQWIANRLTGAPIVSVGHPLINGKFDPVKVDINITGNFAAYVAEDFEEVDGSTLNFKHSVHAVRDNRSPGLITKWRDREATFLQERDKFLAAKKTTT